VEIPLSLFDLSNSTSRVIQEMGKYTKTPLTSQVGGHPGVSTSEDGSLLFKPVLAQEVSFYQSLTSDPAFASLKPYIPNFYGTLRFEGKVEDGNLQAIQKPLQEEKDKCAYYMKSSRGDRPRIYNDNTFDSVGESIS